MIVQTKIILMSHGYMAEETLKSAQMIVGKTENVETISMLADDGLSGTTKKLVKVLENVDNTASILVISDLKGGTPCNVAMMKMQDYPNLRVLTGLNLAMTIEAIMAQEVEIEKFSNELVSVGKEAITKIEIVPLDDEDEFEE